MNLRDIPEEEKQRRIKATKANPWVQLAREGADVWNSFMRRHMGEKQWSDMLAGLVKNGRNFQGMLPSIKLMDDHVMCP